MIDNDKNENQKPPKIEMVEVSEDGCYGKFVCEPLGRGYGITIEFGRRGDYLDQD